MKKLLYLAPLLTLVVMLTGCGKTDVAPDDTTTQPGGSTVEDVNNNDEVTGDTDTETSDDTVTDDTNTDDTNTDDTGNVIDPSIKIKLPPVKIIPIDPTDDDANDQLKDPIVKPDLNVDLQLPEEEGPPLPPIDIIKTPKL